MFNVRLNYKGSNSYQLSISSCCWMRQHLLQTPLLHLKQTLLRVHLCVHVCPLRELFNVKSKSPSLCLCSGQRMIQRKMSWQSLDIIEDIKMTVSNHLSVLLVLIFNLVIQSGHNLYMFTKGLEISKKGHYGLCLRCYLKTCPHFESVMAINLGAFLISYLIT